MREKECERKYCHRLGYAMYMTRSEKRGFMTVECDEHRYETIERKWAAFRRGH